MRFELLGLIAFATFATCTAAAQAEGWRVDRIDTPARVTAIEPKTKADWQLVSFQYPVLNVNVYQTVNARFNPQKLGIPSSKSKSIVL